MDGDSGTVPRPPPDMVISNLSDLTAAEKRTSAGKLFARVPVAPLKSYFSYVNNTDNGY